MCQRAAVRAPEKLTGAAREDSSEDGSDPERQSQANHGRPEPDAAWLVWLLQTRAVFDISGHRRLCASSTSGDLAAPAEACWLWAHAERPSTLAECLLRGAGAFHPS